MADTHETNTLVDLTGLNKAYSINKIRIDNLERDRDEILDGTQAPEYAQKIGSKFSHSQIGNTYNPVYVNNEGVVTPIVSDASTSHSLSLGNENTSVITLGGSGTSSVMLGGNASEAKSDQFSGRVINASSSVNSPNVVVDNKVILRYSNELDALVFDFI